ncbi:MAG: hypothetical protein P4M08_10275 [Oligoflexia bacterium]|nr:hypothetical protein [Oligoflexia bacterium]
MLDLEANEICLDAQGVSENTYSARHVRGRYLISLAVSTRPELLDSDVFNQADIVGLTEQDGRSYFEDVVSITFLGVPDSDLKKRIGVPDEVHCTDCYTLKIGLKTGHCYYKIYDSEFWRYPLPAMPAGWRLAHRFGIGRHFGSPRHENFRDLYFFHEDLNQVYAHFGQNSPTPLPELGEEPAGTQKLFGVTYESARNMRILKLKRYWYPKDPRLENIEKI